MRKMIYIADIALQGCNGGSQSAKKCYEALLEYADHNDMQFQVISLDEEIANGMGVHIKRSRIKDSAARALGHSTHMYFVWKKFRRAIVESQPSVVVLGRSRMGFAAKDIRRLLPDCKVVTVFENIEYDFVEGYFADMHGLAAKILKRIERWCVYKDERMVMCKSHAKVFLSQRDRDRAKEIYGALEGKYQIIPICLPEAIQLKKIYDYKTVVFIGSLNYAPNKDGILWFIDKVWTKFFADRKDVELIVAGSQPDNGLVEKVQRLSNSRLIMDFETVTNVAASDSIIISPTRIGAGMKVKVAETLAMGLSIIASDEALSGYENATQAGLCGIKRANTAEEFRDGVHRYMQFSEQEMQAASDGNRWAFDEFYSYRVAKKLWKGVLDQLLSRS